MATARRSGHRAWIGHRSLSDVARTHRKLRAAGVTADLNLYEGMSHAGYLFVQDSPESRQVFAELDMFLRQHLP